MVNDAPLTSALSEVGVGPGCPVLALCSAGVDSMVLLDLLAHGPWPVQVLHIDHGLRPESASEALALRQQVGVLAGPDRAMTCTVLRVAVAQRAQRWGCGLEEAGRRVRYRAAVSIARRRGIAHVVSAHHGDDQVETILDHILRGAHDAGAAGMAPERSLAAGIALLRPLLAWRRGDILAHARRRGITWCEDPSNADLRWRRNRLRHQVIPALEAGAPGFCAALLQRAEATRHRHQHRQAAVGRWWAAVADHDHLELTGLLAEDQTLRYAFWAHLLHFLSVACDRQRLHAIDDLARGGPGRSLVLGDWRFERHRQRLYWRPCDMPPPPAALPATASVHCAGRILEVQLMNHAGDQIVDPDPWRALIAAAAVVGELCWRTPRCGERWQALGAPGARGLRRYLADHDEPSWRRDRVLLLADDLGVVWIPGHTIAERVRVSDPQAACWLLRSVERDC